MAKKQYKDYQEYLKSDKWKQVKKDFQNNQKTYSNMCEICDEIIEEKEKIYHHWQYPKDWNNDSWENLIVVNRGIHIWIHKLDGDKSAHLKYGDNKGKCIKTRERYIQDLRNKWHEYNKADNYDVAETIKYLMNYFTYQYVGITDPILSFLDLDELSLDAETNLSEKYNLFPPSKIISIPKFRIDSLLEFIKKWGEQDE